MADAREWLRLGTIGVAALIGIPGDVVSLALDRVFVHMDGAHQARARELSTRAADALLSLARCEDEGAVESARLTTESLLARYGLSDESFASLTLDSVRAADAVLDRRIFTPAERDVTPLCRRLLICFYQSLLSDPDAFAELLPHSHREQLRRLGSIELKQDRALEALEEMRADGADVRAELAQLRKAIANEDLEFLQKLINIQVDLARRLIETHRPHAAIELLQGIREAATTARLTAPLHFRVLSNLGNAHLLLLDARTAGVLFLEAARNAPDDDDQAFAQHARAHLLIGELDAAQRVARDGAERFPHSGRLQAMQLAIANQCGQLGDPEALIPPAFNSDFHVAYTVAQIYGQRDDLDRASEWIKIAHETNPKNWQGRKAFAEILLRRAIESNLPLVGAESELKHDFQAAAAELEGIWEVIRTGEHIKASALIAARLAMARGLAGDRDGARRACDAGLAMGPPPPPLLQVAVKLAEEDRRPGDIIALLSEVDTSTMPRLDVVLGSAQADVGRTEDALRTLARVAENSEAEPSVRAVARARSIEIRARLGISSALVDEILGLVAAEPDIVPYHVVAASLYDELGQHDDALVQAHAARKLLDEQATLDDWVSVADLLLELDEPAEAAEILGQLAPHPVDSELGRRLLRALLSADRRAALRTRLDAMPAGEKTDHFYLWIEAALLERIGQLSEAIDLLTKFLQRRPDAAGLRLNWISLLERSDRTEEVCAFLRENNKLRIATPIQQLHYAHILKRHGFTLEALQLGYEETRRAKRDADVHLAYILLVLFTPVFEPFDVRTVELDQGFIFQTDDGVRRTFVIEAGDPLEQAVSLAPGHPISQAANGKRVGDRMEIQEGPYSKTSGSIISVRHKYLILLDDLLENFSHRFPGHTGLFKVTVRELQGAKPDFTELKRAVEDLAARDRSISDQYVEDGLPLPVMAKMLGEHPVRAWGKLSGRRHGIVVCDGNGEEIEAARELLHATPGLVLDPLALNLTHELGIQGALVRVRLPLGVTRSMIESLESLIEELSYHQDGMKSLGIDEDQLTLTEVPAGAMVAYIQGLSGLVTWAREHCEEVPAIAESDLPEEARRLGKAIDRSFIDTIIAAQARGWALLSDDLHFRRIAKLLGVDGVWMQPILQLATEMGALAEQSYQDAVIKLALMNHRFTSLHGRTLLRAVERSDYRLTSEVDRLFHLLADRNVEFRSAMVVLAHFLYGLLNSPAPPKRRGKIFAAVLQSFERHHAGAVLEIHAILEHIAERAFPETRHAHSRRRREWKAHIDAWRSRIRRREGTTLRAGLRQG